MILTYSVKLLNSKALYDNQLINSGYLWMGFVKVEEYIETIMTQFDNNPIILLHHGRISL